MECPDCHYGSIPDGTRFCPNCGQKLPAGAGKTTLIQVSQDIQEVGQGAQVTGASIGKIEGNVFISTDDSAQARERRNLRILLEKVQNYWINGVLAGLLGGAVLIELNHTPQPDLIDNPLVLPENLQPVRETPSDQPSLTKTVRDTFGETEHALLILDGAGSGKTISLLAIARDMAVLASEDPLQPIPVVLNLASWSQTQPSLVDWVVSELNIRYQIPTKFGRQWLEDGNLGLLLDGLDEVNPRRIGDCIAAINQFRQEYGLLPVAVCCRTELYTTAKDALKLGGAVVLQPLSDEQVEKYLASFDPASQAVREVLRDDDTLRSLAHTPLMLNTIRLAYQDLPVEALRSEHLDTPEERRRHLLDSFIESVFSQPAAQMAVGNRREQSTRFLAWLAVQLRRQNQSGFWIEQIQPGWLDGKGQQWIYWLLSRGVVGLLIGLILAGTAEVAGTPSGRAAYVISGVLAGCVLGLLDGLRFEFSFLTRLAANRWQKWLTQGSYALAMGLAAGLVFWLVFGQILHIGQESLRLAAGTALAYGLVFGAAGWRPDPQVDVRPAEGLTWSFKEAKGGILPGLLLAVAAVLVTGLIFASSNPVVVWLPFGITYGLLGFLGLLIIAGLRGKQIERKSFPNQGIWLSARNALRAGLLIGLGAGLLYSIRYGLAPGLVVALRAGVLIFMIYGAFDVVKHLCLRLFLNLFQGIPWRLANYLDEIAALGLLQKAGGGYLFANRLVQDYFGGRETVDRQPKE
jgi:hypothetical protein